jgi:hypothetical protein
MLFCVQRGRTLGAFASSVPAAGSFVIRVRLCGALIAQHALLASLWRTRLAMVACGMKHCRSPAPGTTAIAVCRARCNSCPGHADDLDTYRRMVGVWLPSLGRSRSDILSYRRILNPQVLSSAAFRPSAKTAPWRSCSGTCEHAQRASPFIRHEVVAPHHPQFPVSSWSS